MNTVCCIHYVYPEKGFYTQMLIPPAILGSIVFFRGLLGWGFLGLIDDAPTAKFLCEDDRFKYFLWSIWGRQENDYLIRWLNKAYFGFI